MLALLRVAPLLPSPNAARRGYRTQVGMEKQAQSIEQKSVSSSLCAACQRLMHFYSVPPIHLRSGVDTCERIVFSLLPYHLNE